ncbi:hypothetical protein PHJA_001342100 [Phtheirospermum japonicum]|uniref:Uncharacterized protein n=1 Tax=Phtheirospermum japonicum TaxID=374723 RepID=A0A830BX15_9LAMI|nr:hypothetical protein PHJA_001342100 [Phtheirospermum japonicum]
MAGLHGSFRSNGVRGGLSALLSSPPDEEFQEEDVWGLIPNGPTSPKLRKSKSGSSAPAWRRPAPASATPRSASAAATPVFLRPPPREASKPIDFPDWSRILKEEGRKSHRPQSVKGDDEDDDDDMLPPHELLARRDKKNRAAYSMCEGIGRTLKGRDLRNVRNAVLFKTGFIERM